MGSRVRCRAILAGAAHGGRGAGALLHAPASRAIHGTEMAGARASRACCCWASSSPRRRGTTMQSSRLRALVVGLVGLVSLTTLISLILLARSLLDGSHARGHALLFAGAVLWLTNVLIFAIWYWELDGGGPAQRLAPRRRDSGPRLPVPQIARAADRARLAATVRRLPLHVVHERDRVQPHRHGAAERDGEAADGAAVADRADHDPARGRARGQRPRLRPRRNVGRASSTHGGRSRVARGDLWLVVSSWHSRSVLAG